MSLYIAMALFSLTMSISPGPVNFITLSTGLNKGFRAAIPFISGATIGFTLLLALIGTNLGQLFRTEPSLLKLLGYAGAAYISFMGYKIATSDASPAEHPNQVARFRDGIFLQWLNPKAWAASFAGVSAFNLTDEHSVLWQFIGIYFVICFVGIALWALLGSYAKNLLKTTNQYRILNRILGTTLVGLAAFLLFAQH